MVTRDYIYRLIEQVSEDDLPAAARYLEYLRDISDPCLRALANTPIDDEPETLEEAAAVAEAKEALDRGEARSLDEVRAELLGRP